MAQRTGPAGGRAGESSSADTVTRGLVSMRERSLGPFHMRSTQLGCDFIGAHGRGCLEHQVRLQL